MVKYFGLPDHLITRRDACVLLGNPSGAGSLIDTLLRHGYLNEMRFGKKNGLRVFDRERALAIAKVRSRYSRTSYSCERDLLPALHRAGIYPGTPDPDIGAGRRYRSEPKVVLQGRPPVRWKTSLLEAPPGYASTREAASHLGVHRKTLIRWVDRGTIRGHSVADPRNGRMILVEWDSVLDYQEKIRRSMTYEEAAARLCVARCTCINWLRQGRLETTIRGMVSRESVDLLIGQQERLREFMTMDEAIALTRRSRESLLRMIREGRITAEMHGTWHIAQESLAFLCPPSDWVLLRSFCHDQRLWGSQITLALRRGEVEGKKFGREWYLSPKGIRQVLMRFGKKRTGVRSPRKNQTKKGVALLESPALLEQVA